MNNPATCIVHRGFINLHGTVVVVKVNTCCGAKFFGIL